MLQGPELQEYLFHSVREKFNPTNTIERSVESDRVTVEFQKFKNVLSYLNDKKSFGCDSLPTSYLKRLGYQHAFKLFSLWTSKQMTETENALFSTARLVFLSKSNKEIIKDHKEYRCLAV